MIHTNLIRSGLFALVLAPATAMAGQYVVELDAPFETPPSSLTQKHGMTVDEILSAGADSYVVVTADTKDKVRALFEAASITVEKISEVLFVNSPVVGGGNPAGPEPRDGHQVFVIERPIPGVGFFGLEKKQKISAGSNAAIAKLGEIIEWDHSYLTGEGTYCVYRADSPDTLREHGALAGAPIGKITPVSQKAN